MDISETKSKSPRRPLLAFMLSNGVYLLLVQIWGMKLGPIGDDGTVLSQLNVPWPSAMLLRWEIGTFGIQYVAYHAVNMILLYGCMIAALLFVRTTLQSVWWLGSLAAVLMMANPLKDEAVLTLTGSTILLPVFITLLGLACYAHHCQTGGASSYLISLSLVWFVQWIYPSLIAITGLIVLYEAIANPKERRYWIRVLPFLVVGGVALTHWGVVLHSGGVGGVSFLLVLVLYPIGYLSETVVALESASGYRLVMLGFTLLMVLFTGLKLRSRAYWFGIAGAVCWMTIQPAGSKTGLDLHMLMPIVLINLSFAALCGRVQAHPRWTRVIVTLTTLICLIFFALQIQSIQGWYRSPIEKAADSSLPFQNELR